MGVRRAGLQRVRSRAAARRTEGPRSGGTLTPSDLLIKARRGLPPWVWTSTVRALSDLLNFNIDSALDQTEVGDVSGQDKGAVPVSGQGDQAVVLEFAALVEVEPLVVPDGANKPARSQPVLGKGRPDLGRGPREAIDRSLGDSILSTPIEFGEDDGALPQDEAPRELVQTMRELTLEVANDYIRVGDGVARQAS